MSYNDLRPLTPDDIPELATGLDENLRVAHLRLFQFKIDPTITRDQAQTGVAFFAEVVAQNEQFTTSIKGWLRLKRIPAAHVSEAKRIIRVMAQINRVVGKLTVMAAKIAEAGPERPPLFVILPLSELADVIRVINANIIDARRDIEILTQSSSAPLPCLTGKDLMDIAAQYRHGLALLHVLPFQYRRWRRAALTSVQRRQIAYLARRVRVFRKLMEAGLTFIDRLRGKTVDALPCSSNAVGYMHGLIEDHPVSNDGKR
jgi:hypothetical protein